ncbi:hypothetical protein FH972_005319 [Carpinus fangiana]|uniref:F-box domain-containing protein n=1 Tax=Carpinus fangiana TaxID=176857 RepID=A0A5N6QPU6_9ROSI|nr:hypothetical protein FH972_005319 [Carpinus fangiana]
MAELYGNLGEYLSFSVSSFLKQQILYRNNKKSKSKSKSAKSSKSVVHVYGRWDEVPDDMMGEILGRLNIIDRIRLGGVCKSWRSIVKQKDIHSAPSVPWLLLPHAQNCNSLSFFSMSEGIVHTIKLPEAAQGGWCFGSSKGWLTIARGTQDDPQVFLLSPISGVQRHLPSLTAIPYFKDFVDLAWDPNRITSFIRKIELSSTDLSKCVVAATFRLPMANILAVCKVGDKEWRVFQGLETYFDIKFHEDKLYALVEEGGFESHTMELGSREEALIIKLIPNVSARAPFLIEEETEFAGDIGIQKDGLESHLVESDGELLIVSALMNILFSIFHAEDEEEDEDRSLDFIYSKTTKYQVFKIGWSTSTFTRVASIGDKMLFVSQSESSSLSAPYFNGFSGNQIYFSEDSIDYYGLDAPTPLVCQESGVFYLDDDRIERSFPSINLSTQCQMCWFTPHLDHLL